jgi:hypothetical protein
MAEPASALAVAKRDDPELNRLARIGEWLAYTESGKKGGPEAALRLFYAQELGLPKLAATEMDVINGKVRANAKLLRALAVRAGLRVVELEGNNATSCTASLIRVDTGEEIGRRTYTIEQAQTAGLASKDIWKKHPQRMLWARASKQVVDDYAPEVTLGILSEDEADEIQQADDDEIYVSPIDQTEEYEARSDLVESADDPPPMSKGGLRLPAGTPAADATAAGPNR